MYGQNGKFCQKKVKAILQIDIQDLQVDSTTATIHQPQILKLACSYSSDWALYFFHASTQFRITHNNCLRTSGRQRTNVWTQMQNMHESWKLRFNLQSNSNSAYLHIPCPHIPPRFDVFRPATFAEVSEFINESPDDHCDLDPIPSALLKKLYFCILFFPP
jgi:hypothetical protein